jgi:hypothetical protein
MIIGNKDINPILSDKTPQRIPDKNHKVLLHKKKVLGKKFYYL